MLQNFSELISDEEFGEFNINFERYIGEMSQAVKKVLESQETIEMVQTIYKLTKSEIKSINYNVLLPKLFYFELQLKTVLLKPDFQEVWAALNQTQFIIEESLHKFNTGRWPDFETFVDNFLRKTVGSEYFYDRLIRQFIPEVKENIPEIMKWVRDKVMEDFPGRNIVWSPVINKLSSLLVKIANGDEDWIRQLFKQIRESEWDKAVAFYIGTMADKMTRFVIFHKPDI